MRIEVLGTSPLLTQGSLTGTGSATTPARSDHNHDSTYLKSSAVSNYNTNAKLDAKFNTKVDASDFGTITYSGLDGSDASVYPTSFRKGGTPALPAPTKEGSEFLGWTWSGQGTPTTDPNTIKNAFASAGSVALTANWGAASTGYFFAGSPLDVTSGGTHVIKVAIPDAGKAITSAKLKKVDGSGLVAAGQEGNIGFALGASASAAAGAAMTSWNGSACVWDVSLGGNLSLTEAAEGGSHWLYVGINIPASAINKDAVVKSYVPGDYVASLVTLEYELAS